MALFQCENYSWKCASLFLLFVYFIPLVTSEDIVRCHAGSRCIALSKCRLHQSSSTFIYPCHSGLNLICCPTGSYNDTTAVEDRKIAAFPVNCGLVITSDKIVGGEEADFGQFPWMALLGYRQRNVDYTQFLCGGSLITEHYVLTAAHCLNLHSRLELVVARFGEHYIDKSKDCYKIDTTEICADPPVDHDVERTIAHPEFDTTKLYNDIALVKLRTKVHFTDYIKPICLPFERNLEDRDLQKQILVVSGWGKTDSNNLGGSSRLQFASVVVWNQTTCSRSIDPEVKPLRTSQLCANGKRNQDACKGDSGGPLVNATVDADGELRYFQLGIVSYASTVTCGNPQLPTVYTRVDKFLAWVVETVS